MTVPEGEEAPAIDEAQAAAERLSEELDAADVFLPWRDEPAGRSTT